VKALPCKGCSDGVARLRGGEPYLSRRFPGGAGPYTYQCEGHRTSFGLKQRHSITAQEFNALPEVTPRQLEEWNLLDLYAGDLRPLGLSTAQAADMLRAGFWTKDDVIALGLLE
jgi:hypothetical protein